MTHISTYLVGDRSRDGPKHADDADGADDAGDADM